MRSHKPRCLHNHLHDIRPASHIIQSVQHSGCLAVAACSVESNHAIPQALFHTLRKRIVAQSVGDFEQVEQEDPSGGSRDYVELGLSVDLADLVEGEAVDFANRAFHGVWIVVAEVDGFVGLVLPRCSPLVSRREVVCGFASVVTYGRLALQADQFVEVRVSRTQHCFVDGNVVAAAEHESKIGP